MVYEEAEQPRAARDDAPYEHDNEELAPRNLNFGATLFDLLPTTLGCGYPPLAVVVCVEQTTTAQCGRETRSTVWTYSTSSRPRVPGAHLSEFRICQLATICAKSAKTNRFTTPPEIRKTQTIPTCWRPTSQASGLRPRRKPGAKTSRFTRAVLRSSFSGAFVALAVVAEPEPALQRSAVYDAYLLLVRNRAIAELEESTQPAKVGFFQLCGSKCGKQIASKVFYNLLGKQPITGKRALAVPVLKLGHYG